MTLRPKRSWSRSSSVGWGLADHAHFKVGAGRTVGSLDEEAAVDAPDLGGFEVEGWARGGLRPAHDAEVLAAAEATEGGWFVVGGDDDVVKVAAHGGNGFGRDGSVEAEDAAECGDWISLAGAAVGLDLGLGVDGQAAGHGVLDDRDGDVVEVVGGGPGGLQVEDVDVGELQAVELLDAGEFAVAKLGGASGVEGAGLVGVLAVSKVLETAQGDGEQFREGLAVALLQVGGDVCVVEGGQGEGLGGQFAAECLRTLGVVHRIEHPCVVGGVDDDPDVVGVLGGGPDEGDAADVDVFKEFETVVGVGQGGGEGVEVDGDEVDRADAEVGEFGQVLGGRAAGEDAAVDGGVKGLDAAVEHFGGAGDVFNWSNRMAGGGNCVGGSARGQELPASGRQTGGQVFQPGLVEDADQGAGCGHRAWLSSELMWT